MNGTIVLDTHDVESWTGDAWTGDAWTGTGPEMRLARGTMLQPSATQPRGPDSPAGFPPLDPLAPQANSTESVNGTDVGTPGVCFG